MKQKKSSKLKWGIIFSIPLIIGAAMFYRAKMKAAEPTRVVVQNASLRSITETVYASGKVFPATEIEITSNISGTLIQLAVKEGENVKKGQLLAKVDAEALASVVERAQAASSSSRAQLQSTIAQKEQLVAQLKNAKQILDRNQKLFDDGVIASAELQATQTSFETAKASLEAATQNIKAAEFGVKSAEATVREQQKNLSQSSIYAPIDGVVSTLYKKQGEQVVGTAQMAGSPILKIANLNSVEVRVDVNERDILNTALNDTARIELDAYPEQKFNGIITQIANTASGLNSLGVQQLNSDQVTNFEVRILILPESYQHLNVNSKKSPFRAGLSASAEILTNKVENILTVPVAAVTARIPEDASYSDTKQKMSEYVFVQQGDSVLLTEVETGIQNDNFIHIKKGITANTPVIKAPYDAISKKLANGDKIKVVAEKELYRKKR
jgi:HlyD family secretion protein